MVTPDAILMDAVMPGASGFEVCRKIKESTAWRHIPVIFMTGLSETDSVVEGFRAGGVDYVVKPLRSAEVLARLLTHVRNARAVRVAQQALDLGGKGVLVLDRWGRIAWESPISRTWREQGFGAGADAQTTQWLAGEDDPAHPGHRVRRLPDGQDLHARRIGDIGFGEVLWILDLMAATTEDSHSRVATASLTPRETEVLSWVAKGKTNRDIAEILGMSPRTVNKHLEHVFEKLGVETRSAAAALASRGLG